MSVPPPSTEEELHAFVDGELGASRRGEILLLLEADAALATRVARYRADRDRLRAAFAHMPLRPIPDVLLRLIETPTTSRPPAAVSRRFAVAASIALVTGAAALTVRERFRGDTILADAEAARGGPVRGSSATSDQLASARSRNELLQAALGLKVGSPSLERYGFHLTRLELLGHAIQLRYVDEQQRELTIYVRRSDGNVRFDLLRQGATRICIWQDNVVGAVIIAPISAGEMMRVASSAYSDLDL